MNPGHNQSITVNSTTADRLGNLFTALLSGNNNADDPVWLTAAVTDGTTTQTRHAWLPAATTAPEYDDDGNLTNDGQWSYLWDAENRLVEMETTQAAVTAGRPYRRLTFAYDWTGRRRARNIYGPNSTILSATKWLYDGWNPVAEFSDQTTGQALVRAYLWGMDMSGTMQGAGGIGGLLSVFEISNSQISNRYFPSYDGNGNIVAWTASGATAPACLREYDSFGNILIEHGTPPCAIGFSTKPEDPETGLLYYGHRYLSPLLGRWLSRDPIGEEGGLNLYGFVRNEPVARIDKLGMITIPLSAPFWDISSLSSVCESQLWVGFFSEYRHKTYHEMFSLLARTPLRRFGNLEIWRMPKDFMGRIFWTSLGNKGPAVTETEHFVDGWVTFCRDWCYTVDIDVELVVHSVRMNAKYLGNLDKMKMALAHEFDHIANEIRRMDIVVDHLNTNPGRKRFGTKQEAIAYLDDWKDKIDRILLGTRLAEARHHKGVFLPRTHDEYDPFLDTWTGPRGDFRDTPGSYELRPWDGSPDPDWDMAWR